MLLLISLLKSSILDLTYSITAALFHRPILIIVGTAILLRYRSIAKEVLIDFVPTVEESNPKFFLPIESTVALKVFLIWQDLM